MTTQARNPNMTKLVAEITAFQAAHGMADSAFGAWAINDPNLIRDLREGRELRWGTIQAIRAKMQGADNE